MNKLDGKETLMRLMLKIDGLLDDGNYKHVKRGQQLYIEFCKKKVNYWIDRNDRV